MTGRTQAWTSGSSANASQDAADHAAQLYAATRKAGTPVDDIDILIAGTALAHGRVVVTGNTTHFDKLPGVQVENWAA